MNFLTPWSFQKGDNVFFLGDPHFGHRCEHWETPLWRSRGYESVDEHDIDILARCNAKFNEKTNAFILGDFLFGLDGLQRLKAYFDRLNFRRLFLMPGNHYAGFKQLVEDPGVTWQGKNLFGIYKVNATKEVIIIPNYFEVYIEHQPIVLSHYPIVSWNGQAKGSWMIHGHCHGNLYKSAAAHIYDAKIIDVGFDVWKTPLSFNDIRERFKDKQDLSFDHHSNTTLTPFS